MTDTPNTRPALPGYTAGAVIACAGITYRQLDHWTRCGYIRPDQPHPNTGKSRLYPATEAEVAARIADLVGAGFTLWAAATLARRLPDQPTIPLTARYTLTEQQDGDES